MRLIYSLVFILTLNAILSNGFCSNPLIREESEKSKGPSKKLEEIYDDALGSLPSEIFFGITSHLSDDDNVLIALGSTSTLYQHLMEHLFKEKEEGRSHVNAKIPKERLWKISYFFRKRALEIVADQISSPKDATTRYTDFADACNLYRHPLGHFARHKLKSAFKHVHSKSSNKKINSIDWENLFYAGLVKGLNTPTRSAFETALMVYFHRNEDNDAYAIEMHNRTFSYKKKDQGLPHHPDNIQKLLDERIFNLCVFSRSLLEQKYSNLIKFYALKAKSIESFVQMAIYFQDSDKYPEKIDLATFFLNLAQKTAAFSKTKANQCKDEYLIYTKMFEINQKDKLKKLSHSLKAPPHLIRFDFTNTDDCLLTNCEFVLKNHNPLLVARDFYKCIMDRKLKNLEAL